MDKNLFASFVFANPIFVAGDSLTDRVTLDALLDRTLSLSASTVLCYPAANYTYVITWRSRDFLEVFICRAVNTIFWNLAMPEVGSSQHRPGVGGKRLALSSRNGRGWVGGATLYTSCSSRALMQMCLGQDLRM